MNENGGISFQNVLEGIRNCDIQLESISYDKWRDKLMSESKQNGLLKSAEEFFINSPFKQRSTLSVEQYSNEVSQLSFSPLNNDYIIKWLLFILNNIIRTEK
jgi:hypothetical protein